MNKRKLYGDGRFATRAESDELIIEGYFAVFNSLYDRGYWAEMILPGSFDGIAGDANIKALINHDDTFVLGRTGANTLELRQDNTGLWGKITINPKDQDAINLYERVKRRDVYQCSIGFDILEEEAEHKPDGSILWKLRKVKLYEVSVVTFPAYEETNVEARGKSNTLSESRLNVWRESRMKKLKGEKHGT